MATTRPSQAKRQKERDRVTRQKDKMAQRAQRKEEKARRPSVTDGEDPDIAGIVPGPQPILE
jgi:hypothetical protein